MHAGDAGRSKEQRVQRPAEGGDHADADQGIHRHRAMAGVDDGGAVKRPRAPHHDGRRERESEPLPVGELKGRDHRHQYNRDGERSRDDQPVLELGDLPVDREFLPHPNLRRDGQGGRITSGLDGGDERGGLHAVGLHRGLLGRVIDRCADAVDLIELALDPVGAGGAGHAPDLEADIADGHPYAGTRVYPASVIAARMSPIITGASLVTSTREAPPTSSWTATPLTPPIPDTSSVTLETQCAQVIPSTR